jgi:hypothetical protein
MLALGAAAFNSDGVMAPETFHANIFPLFDSKPDPNTMKWWRTQPVAWESMHKDLMIPLDAMSTFMTWVNSLHDQLEITGEHKLVFVGYPAPFDFMFVQWYLGKYGFALPFGHQALDLKSYAMAHMKTEFMETHKGSMPREWFTDLPEHTHLPVDDAIQQGLLFFRMRQAVLAGGRS